jgi:hypothetical protein
MVCSGGRRLNWVNPTRLPLAQSHTSSQSRNSVLHEPLMLTQPSQDEEKDMELIFHFVII